MFHHHFFHHHPHAKRQLDLAGRAAASTGSSSSGSSSSDDDSSGSSQSTVKVSSVVQSTVFVTASPTFTGAIAGFSTILPESTSEETRTTKEQSTSTQGESSTSIQVILPVTTSTSETTETPTSTAVPTTASSSAIPTAITTASTAATTLASVTQSLRATRVTSSSVSATSHKASATAAAQSGASTGLSGGAKVGIVLAVLLAVALAAGATLWFFAKKKREREQSDLDEKDPFANTGGPMAGSKAAMKAPRLSLRPMTQFFGNSRPGDAGGSSERPLPMTAAGANRNLTGGTAVQSPWERRAAERNGQNPFKDPSNPFSDRNKAPSPPMTPTISITPPQSSPAEGNQAAGAAVAGAATAGMAAGAAKGVTGPADVNANDPVKGGPDSPDSAKSSGNGNAGGAAGGPAPGNVHRVQLDFKPSMDDELELVTGALVRVLHEYDDGWALCSRLDRSQQGVAPRTCLSARPVKPRPAPGPGPNGPPRGPPVSGPPVNGPSGHPRGPPGPGPQGRPMSPGMRNGPPAGQQRPMSPAMRNGPRPASPGQPRPMSPGMGPDPRPASPGMGPRPGSPAGQQPRPMSPAMRGNPQQNLPRKPSPMGPGGPYSPPGAWSGQGPPPRSMSPGPHGAPGAPTLSTPVSERSRGDSDGVALNAAADVKSGSNDNGFGWRPPKPATQDGVPPPTSAPTTALPPAPTQQQLPANSNTIGRAISSEDEKTMQFANDLQSY